MFKYNQSLVSNMFRVTAVCLIGGVLFLSSCSNLNLNNSSSNGSSFIVSNASSVPSSASASISTSSFIASSTVPSSDPVKEVKDYLAGLTKTEMGSGKLAIDFINSKTTAGVTSANKDILLGLYLDFSYQLVFKLMGEQFNKLDTLRKSGQAAFNVLVAQNGLQITEVDGSFVLVPDYNIIITSMNGILSENGKVYCGLMVTLDNKEPIASEAGILIPLAELKSLQSEWAAFVAKITPATDDFPPSDSTYKAHFVARQVLSRLDYLVKSA